jgi:tetratricopeptide (TPR) repeat protein
MKRVLVLIGLLAVVGYVPAQQPVNWLLKARAYLDYGKNNEAIATLSEGLAKNSSNDYRFYVERAEGYLANGDFTNAMKDCQAANSLAPFSGEYGLSKIFARKGDVQNALNHLEANIGSPFRKSEKEIFLDPSFSSVENTSEWRQFWKKERYGVPEEKISEIEYSINRGKIDDALVTLNELAADYNGSTEFFYAKAMIDISLGKSSESISMMIRLLDSDKKNEKYLRLLAKAQMASMNPSGASQTYSYLIDMGIIDASLYIQRSECYNKTGENDKAIRDISVFLDLYPDNKIALRLAGKTESVSGDNLKALDYFTRNLNLHPGDPDCYIDRANSYFVSGTWNNAINDYSMALDIRPSDQEAWLNKGIALLKEGKAEDACHDFNVALSLGNKKATSYISRYCIK